MFEHLFHPVTQGTLGVTWHHLPALYMLDSHLMAMAVMGCTAVAILFILMPVLRKRLATVLVVLTCVLTGFLMGYSVTFPDWQVAYAVLPPESISYQELGSSRYSVLKFYSQHLGLHIGLKGANITLLAVPFAASCPPILAKTPFPKACFPELNPFGCPGRRLDKNPSGTLVENRTKAPNPLFSDANKSVSASPKVRQAASSRRLFSIDEEIEELYSGKRSKPLHFPRSAAPDVAGAARKERNGSLHPLVKASSKAVKLDNFSLVNSTNISGNGTKKAVKRCWSEGDVLSAAWFDEWVDFEFGTLTVGHIEKLNRGVPASILTLSEYLSRKWDYGAGGGEGSAYGGFDDWAHRFRHAGHYTAFLLYSALVLWIFSIPLQMSEPESGAKLLGLSGTLMAAAAPLYASLAQPHPGDALRVCGVVLNLRWGPCFYTSLFGGLWAALAGFSLAMLRNKLPGAISTDLDLEELNTNRIEIPTQGVPGIEMEKYSHEFT